MPDTIEERLAESRQRLLEHIDQPELSVIARRARTLRRRRLAVRAAAVAVLVVFGGTAVARPWQRSPGPTPAGVQTTLPPGGVWTAAGITINGQPAYSDVPGEVIDAEFTDADRGYLLAADCRHPAACVIAFGATDDGGRTWQTMSAPADVATARREALPVLVTLGAQVTIATSPAARDRLTRYVSDDGGRHWVHERGAWADADAQPLAALPERARPLAVKGQDGCAGKVYAWLPRAGSPADPPVGLAALANQPPINVCWAASAPASDGAWWVGGVEAGATPGHGRAAVAVSRDRGRTWTAQVFEDRGATGARVATLGREVFVATLGSSGSPANSDSINTVYASDDLGATFTGHRHSGAPATLAGDLVPLLDGRLLLVDAAGLWYVTADRGTTWTNATGLHKTGRLARTPAGYVAYQMTGVYTAFSVDGSTWRKLSVT